ncbi:hypothetical protein LAZ67_14000520 [Cordylochernes scorpioides]|uniref:Integrase catalytic domain-containing protein n=1 Tax=Cordylochernes scorpioides TaxID=51811 RepID=A0ABY6L7Q3_9ARAC|nr:hypothetical protein LAZ67_14000520 [Cordylochernes scorpioides]
METQGNFENLKTLKELRTPRRIIFTKKINEVLEELRRVSPDEDLLMKKKEFIVQHYQQIKEYNRKIEIEIIRTEEHDEKAVLKELESSTHYEEMYIDVLVEINKVLEAKTEEKRAMSEAGGEGSRRALLRLPKMELPCFDGDLEGWLSWWSRFKRIHEDRELDDDEKMHYLVQAMVPGSRAHRLLGAYTHTGKNYESAIGALKGRFGDRKLLIELYLRKLINLVVLNARRQSANLDRLYDEISAYLQSLESLSIPSEYLEVFLFPLVESCLPTEIMQVWQRTPEAGYGRDDEQELEQGKGDRLKALMGFLRAEIKAQQRMNFSRLGVGENNPKYSFPSRPLHFNKSNKSTASQLYVSKNKEYKYPKGSFSTTNFERKTKCIFCDGMSHENWKCFKIGRMTREEQLKKMSDVGVCFKCLKGNHLRRDCRTKIICQNCGGPHYLIFCRGNTSRRDSITEDGDSSKEIKNNSSVQNQQSTVLLAQSCASEILLMTVRAKICSSETSKVINVLLDSGSQYSFIKESLAKELGLEKLGERKLTKCLFGGRQTREEKHSLYSLFITNLLKEEAIQVRAMGQRMICDRVPTLTAGTWMRDLDKRGVTIIRKKNVETSEVDLLLGADNLGKIWTDQVVCLEDGLTAIKTKIGWSIFGEIPLRESLASEYASPVFLTMSHKIKDLWDLEMLGVRDPVENISQREKNRDIKSHFIEKIIKRDDGHYSVSLPWKEGCEDIPSNFHVAQKRLERCVNKLTTQGRLEDYSKIFTEWEQENIIERIHDDNKTVGHYLPHRPVFKETNETTPIRPVYDASCRSVKGMSLNDCLETGPNLLERIPNVLIRFRENKIGISADIRKAFQMIEVNPEDRKYLKFIWRNISGSVTFQHTRVVFGLTSSPFILGAVIEHHLKSVTDENFYVAQRLLRSFYVDNCLTSPNKKSHIVHFKEKASEIMNRAGMELRQWETAETFNPREGKDAKVLGLLWNRKTDTLNCMINPEILPSLITRRVILSLVQKLFDPLGFYSPVMITPKILLQKTWKSAGGWDNPLEEDISQEFKDWYEQLSHLKDSRIPRYICVGWAESLELHVFCDASKEAFATVAYMRSQMKEGVKLSFIWSKARVAPLGKISIPRLELMACLIGARLAGCILESLTVRCQLYLWTDSSTALSWIRKNCNWNIFVKNRVDEIQKTTKVSNWRFVPGFKNPADLPSRGSKIGQFLRSKWWEGPDWLRLSREFWPSEEPIIDETEVLKEQRKTTLVEIVIKPITHGMFKKFSEFQSNVRLLAWMTRYINKCRKASNQKGELTIEEIEYSERKLIQLIQREVFDLGNLKFNNLKIVKNAGDLCSVETKLILGDFPENFKYPVLLPSSHFLSEQLVRQVHKKLGHAGVLVTLSKLREKYWILRGRKTVSRILRQCVICRRYSAKPGSVEAAPLPTNRIHLGKPFQVTGIDLFGPLLLRNNTKTWVALFTCGVYRAVHMEVIQGLDTPSFLMALRRFISRRGRPLVIYSDNGTNFAKTNKLLSHIDWDQMSNYSSAQKIIWKFNPPVSPWWGGFWERLIRIIKGELVQKKEDSDTRAITAGEVVYVGNDSQKRINWPLGLVKKVYPGEDGNCRVAKVRIKSGEIVRPIQRLYPLEIRSSDMEACGVQNLGKASSSLGHDDK